MAVKKATKRSVTKKVDKLTPGDNYDVSGALAKKKGKPAPKAAAKKLPPWLMKKGHK